MIPLQRWSARVRLLAALFGCAMLSLPAAGADEGPPKPVAERAPAAPLALSALSWLEGCWHGNANRRDFREVWLPMRGAMMLGVSQTVLADKTLDYEYLRLETRADGVYYVTTAPGKPDSAFKLTQETVDEEDAHTFVFLDPAREFPSRIAYRRASEGWLYTEVEGKVSGAERKVIYPMRRVNCATGEFVRE